MWLLQLSNRKFSGHFLFTLPGRSIHHQILQVYQSLSKTPNLQSACNLDRTQDKKSKHIQKEQQILGKDVEMVTMFRPTLKYGLDFEEVQNVVKLQKAH